ncbi:MAG: amino acid ABC transporter permease [Firmicutes bacterium]|nr:amino acid ABC transporter permease [Bacillota bacterium]MBQ4339921.1 amino acid ABC transporter permease [Bacillota bacterium]
MIVVLEKIITTGVAETLKVTVVALFFGVLIGLFACLGRMSKYFIPRAIATSYIEIIRGTPTLVQALFFYFGVNGLLVSSTGGDIRMTPLVAGMIVCSLNSGAYVAEIFRAGIQSVDKGQMEAARSLGMPQKLAMKEIILPQAVRTILPSLGNEFIVLVKETSILSVIGVTEITRVGQIQASINYKVFSTYLGVAIVYFVLTFTLSRLVNYLERRMAVSD